MLFNWMILLWKMPWVSGSHALRNSHTYRDLYLPCNSSLCQMFILSYPSSQALTHFVRFTHSPCLLLHGPMSTGDTVAPFRISDERSHHEPRCINDNWTIRYLLTIVTSPAAQERRGMPFFDAPFLPSQLASGRWSALVCLPASTSDRHTSSSPSAAMTGVVKIKDQRSAPKPPKVNKYKIPD